MTKPIEGVSERILSCAKEGFLEKGYADASLRTIAAKAETTTGSIYSRFRDQGRTVWRSGGTGSRRQNAGNFKRIRLRIFFEWK